MATMSSANLNALSTGPFSPQMTQEFENQEVSEGGGGGFNEKEILVSQLESANSAKLEMSAQLEFLKKKYQGLQDELQSTLQSQTNLEKQYYSVEADLEKAREREEETGRRLRDLEFKFDKESKDFELEKARFSEREAGLRSQLKNLHAQQQLQKGQPSPTMGRASRTRSVSVSFSPPAFLPSNDLVLDDALTETGEAALMHEAQIANRTVRLQLKEIGTLKATVTQLKEQIASQKNQELIATKQLKHNQSEVERLTLANATLMEEIESYQLLLENRTLRGQFTLAHHASDFSLAEPTFNSGGFNLGSELSQALSPVEEEDSASVAGKDELRQLKDENKALTLYISKILGKIMSNPVLAEAITNNGDASADQPEKKSTPAPIQQTEAPAPPAAEPKDKSSRFSGFLSPTFGMGGFSSPAPTPEPERAGRGVSFDLPASTPRPIAIPSRNSTDSVCNDQVPSEKPKSGSQSPFRSRRSKSMSVNNHSDEKQTSGSGFNFRSALKRMTGTWKGASKSTPSIASATSESIQEEPEGKESSK